MVRGGARGGAQAGRQVEVSSHNDVIKLKIDLPLEGQRTAGQRSLRSKVTESGSTTGAQGRVWYVDEPEK